MPQFSASDRSSNRLSSPTPVLSWAEWTRRILPLSVGLVLRWAHARKDSEAAAWGQTPIDSVASFHHAPNARGGGGGGGGGGLCMPAAGFGSTASASSALLPLCLREGRRGCECEYEWCFAVASKRVPSAGGFIIQKQPSVGRLFKFSAHFLLPTEAADFANSLRLQLQLVNGAKIPDSWCAVCDSSNPAPSSRFSGEICMPSGIVSVDEEPAMQASSSVMCSIRRGASPAAANSLLSF
ncbi:hypothetical protein C8R47DRAFT_1080151 [Mycena vitilis]|nr:hypothetical protein C8R47DRAFT_1080151 [Mycena vitilis]